MSQNKKIVFQLQAAQPKTKKLCLDTLADLVAQDNVPPCIAKLAQAATSLRDDAPHVADSICSTIQRICQDGACGAHCGSCMAYPQNDSVLPVASLNPIARRRSA